MNSLIDPTTKVGILPKKISDQNKWILTFSEEFKGNILNENKWNTVDKNLGSQEKESLLYDIYL